VGAPAAGERDRSDGEVPDGATTDGFTRGPEHERFRGRVVTLVTGEFSDPDGHRFTRDIVHHPGAVAVVPVHDDGRVTLVRQFRAAVGRSMLEAPAGTRDVDGEAPERTARRELAEEAGLEADHLEHLATFYNSPGFCDQETSVYLATGLRPCATERGGIEERFMTVESITLGQVASLTASGQLADAQTLLGLALAARRLGDEVTG
jgi:8-oxo-dGTP pyrophosphatase MutT (NUDIX family)